MDKAGLCRALQELAIPHPMTVILNHKQDLEALPQETIAGSILKPRDSESFFKRYGVKAFRLRTLEDMIRKYEEIEKAGMSVVFQEYIPGPASRHYFIDGFIDRTGNCKVAFARHRLRMFPPDFGNSSYLVSVPIEEVATARQSLLRLLSHVGYRGIFSAEFKLDERDREFKLLEVNVRPWWYIWFAEQCGVPVALMAYLDSQEIEIEAIENYRTGVGLVNPYYDFHACIELFRKRQLSTVSWAKSWLTSRKSNFSMRDPMPSIIGLLDRLSLAFRKRTGRSSRRDIGSDK
jgi:predicted ATP-grasp superfamily ATP-dependent carboligase